MEVDKSILLQKQVRDNSEDLQSEFLDMKNWEEQMKRKDLELRNAAGDQVLPPIRTKKKKIVKKSEPKIGENENQNKRIKAHDYTAWDKFDVDKACEELDKKDQSGESEEEEMSAEELERNHAEATKHKNQGNILVQKQQWTSAITCYTKAMQIFPYDAVFYANRALCYLKIDNLYSAEADCTTAIQLDGLYVKAYHRRATARMALKQFKEAKQDLDKLLDLEPNNKDAKIMLSEVEKKIESTKPVVITEKKETNEAPIERKIGEKLWGGIVKKPEPTDKVSNPTKRIPCWRLGEGEDVAIVDPIVKPPHQRSKEPLRRIKVAEIEIGQTEPTMLNFGDKGGNSSAGSETETQKQKIPTENSHKQDAHSRLGESGDAPIDEIPPEPKTAIQFLMNWKKNKSAVFRYRYLKKLPADSIHKVFKDSMESDTFSDILATLASEFVRREEPIFLYLVGLTQVKRFGALTMFMTAADKKELRTMFEYCKTSENVSHQELSQLLKKFEIED